MAPQPKQPVTFSRTEEEQGLFSKHIDDALKGGDYTHAERAAYTLVALAHAADRNDGSTQDVESKRELSDILRHGLDALVKRGVLTSDKTGYRFAAMKEQTDAKPGAVNTEDPEPEKPEQPAKGGSY